MVKKHHKILSLVLCLMLAISAVCAGTVGAFAASGDTVYVRLNNGWSNVYCYMWVDNSTNNGAWPGVQMTKVEDGVYSYSLTGNYTKVIFNNGSGGNGNQTSDLDYAGDGKIYDLTKNTWSDYGTPATNPTTATTATTPTQVQPTTPSGDGTTVYLKNTAGWSSVTCYMWNSATDSNAGWPGAQMTSLGDDVYQYTASKSFASCIFSNSGNSQTSDLTAQNGYIYDNSTNQWSVYDTSPLQIKSYTTDPANGSVYVDGDVVVSANAVNANGATVSYQFSVTNASGANTVLSSFSSATSTVWTPKAAGDYTINYDFKDTDGNTNNRTLKVSVIDDSTLTKPVIKSVFPASLNLIQTNKATTVSVKAGGAKTGTNLIFYKYIVTDPSGVKNTPYYTLNSTYSFTPTKTGTYTVQVFVEGSDNSRANKTYTYTATNLPVTDPTTPTVQPTTVAPTTVAPTTVAPTSSTTPVTVKGDADGDGRLTIKDATYMQKNLADYDGYPISSITQCDMDGDGRVSIKDATLIQKQLSE